MVPKVRYAAVFLWAIHSYEYGLRFRENKSYGLLIGLLLIKRRLSLVDSIKLIARNKAPGSDNF